MLKVMVDVFIYTLRDNCYQQLVSSQVGIPPSVKVLPLIKIDEENHKEKSEKEWETLVIMKE